jgi:tRNA threonylcarbamoyladenosine biosynthesis protein TsaB
MMHMASNDANNLSAAVRTWLAALDTSSDRAGVALFDGREIATISWNAHRNHTVDTLAQLDHLLQLSGGDLNGLVAVAVATGPGSFSALRVGLSIGKGLAFSLDIPLIGVPTTDAIAGQLAWTGRPVVAVMTAGRGRVVWSRYDQGELQNGPHNTTIEELSAVAGEIDALVAGETELLEGIGSVSLPAGGRVEQIARLGWARFQNGERDDPALLEPVYAHGRRSQDVLPA